MQIGLLRTARCGLAAWLDLFGIESEICHPWLSCLRTRVILGGWRVLA
jgi:hypothetical protein